MAALAAHQLDAFGSFPFGAWSDAILAARLPALQPCRTCDSAALAAASAPARWPRMSCCTPHTRRS